MSRAQTLDICGQEYDGANSTYSGKPESNVHQVHVFQNVAYTCMQ